ncbi:unnamed protein product [Moneuplotes crassus]|uniref:Uncharacterized protein n=1 Tax=Euplotes crassus TaxID=5936 RepID=A0AAD1UHT8_EUPCR|nr:unnamed protein product [Moneuplotes crassus]
MKQLYIPQLDLMDDKHADQGLPKVDTKKSAKLRKKKLVIQREIAIKEMIQGQHRREEIMKEMDIVLRKDQGTFDEIERKSKMDPNRTGRLKNASKRKAYMSSTSYNPTKGGSSLLGTSRLFPKRIAGVTGISTYLYEVNTNPMKECLKSSAYQRRKKLLINMNNCSKNTSRSKTEGRGRYKGKVHSKKNKLHHTSKIESYNSNNHDISIFEKLPQQFNPKLAASVDVAFKKKRSMKNNKDMKNLPSHVQKSMEKRINSVLNKRASRVRSKPKQSPFPKATRDSIAFRIMSKLREWPVKEEKISKSFKKFYWTKDFSHCAFANDEEVIDGYLSKP